eukprot:2610999-Amphidinium_carterae.2
MSSDYHWNILSCRSSVSHTKEPPHVFWIWSNSMKSNPYLAERQTLPTCEPQNSGTERHGNPNTLSFDTNVGSKPVGAFYPFVTVNNHTTLQLYISHDLRVAWPE